MNPSLQKILKDKEKLENDLKKKEESFIRYITDNLWIGYSISASKCYFRLGNTRTKGGFTAYFPVEKISHLIEQLEQLQKSIDE